MTGSRGARLRFDDRRAARRDVGVLAARALTTVYRRMLCLAYPMSDAVPRFRRAARAVLGELGIEHAAVYAAHRPGAPSDAFHRRLAAGQRCFGAWRDGALLATGWAATGTPWVAYLDARLGLAADDVYVHDLYTSPDARGRGLHLTVTAHVIDACARSGFARGVGLIAVEHHVPRATFARTTAAEVGRYAVLRLGPWRRHVAQARSGARLPALLPGGDDA